MRFIKFSSVALVVGLIAGCGMHSQSDYAKKARVTPPLDLPKHVSLRSEQNYYPLPQQPNLKTKQPSLVPPGSDLARFSAKKKAVKVRKPQHFTRAKWSEAGQGEPILALMESQNTAWLEVGKALRDTDYQILDQDPTMSSYYILDTKLTDNEVTEKTPIYRVYIEKDKDNSSKIVLMDEDNNMVAAKTAKRVLRDLEQHLA